MLKRLIAAGALSFAIASILVFTSFALVGDVLFFMSDMRSMLTVGLLLTPIVLVPLAATLLACRLFGIDLQKINRALCIFLAALIGTNSFFFLINLLDSKFLVTIRAKYLLSKYSVDIYPEFLWIPFWGGLLFLAWRWLKRSDHLDEYIQRTRIFALMAVPLYAALLGISIVDSPPTMQAGKSPKHLVLVILDGWPSALSPTFNPALGEKKQPEFMKEALTFTNVHTSTPWTNGFFGTLYSGKQGNSFKYLDKLNMIMEEGTTTKSNLISELQGNGVTVRGIYYHRNGMPESCAGKVTNYKGFRSLLGLPKHTPLLDAAGLDYFIVTRGPSGRANLWNDARSWLMSRLIPALEPEKHEGNVLIDLLLPEMKRIDQKANDTALIFHYSWAFGAEALPAAWNENDDSQEEQHILKAARKSGYRYLQKDEVIVSKMRDKAAVQAAYLETQLAEFIRMAGAEGTLADTTIIVTADHGTSYSGGRLWYGYHPHENVTKIPLLVFGAKRTGTDNRLIESTDLSQTILTYFGIDTRFAPEAKDILGTDTKDSTVTITQPSDASKEWFAIVYKNGRKTMCNIHPKGDGLCTEYSLNGFTETPLQTSAEPLNQIKNELRQAFGNYALTKEISSQLHPNFAPLQPRENEK